jgi:hypothetical protein
MQFPTPLGKLQHGACEKKLDIVRVCGNRKYRRHNLLSHWLLVWLLTWLLT